MKNLFLITEKGFLPFQGPHRIRKREEKKEQKKSPVLCFDPGRAGIQVPS